MMKCKKCDDEIIKVTELVAGTGTQFNLVKGEIFSSKEIENVERTGAYQCTCANCDNSWVIQKKEFSEVLEAYYEEIKPF